MYIDTAMSEYWRAGTAVWGQHAHPGRRDVCEKKATVEYHASAKLDDTLDVGMRCARIGNSSCVFESGHFSAVTGCWSLANWSTCLQTRHPDIPPHCLPRCGRCWRGSGRCRDGRSAQATGIRWAAMPPPAHGGFVREQDIPADVETDALDASARHRCSTTAWGSRWLRGGCCSKARRGPHRAHGGGPVRARCPVGPCASGCVGLRPRAPG